MCSTRYCINDIPKCAATGRTLNDAWTVKSCRRTDWNKSATNIMSHDWKSFSSWTEYLSTDQRRLLVFVTLSSCPCISMLCTVPLKNNYKVMKSTPATKWWTMSDFISSMKDDLILFSSCTLKPCCSSGNIGISCEVSSSRQKKVCNNTTFYNSKHGI